MTATIDNDEILRRIGRNLMLYQDFELALEFLVSIAHVEGPADRIQSVQHDQLTALDGRTLGELLRRFRSSWLAPESDWPELDAADEVWLGMRHRLELDEKDRQHLCRELDQVVTDRNFLVHSFRSEWGPAPTSRAEWALATLDQQFERGQYWLRRLRELAHVRQEAARWLASPEALAAMELEYLRRSRIVELLGDAASRSARADGWTLLSSAGHAVKQYAPDELAEMPVRYGHSTLKALILATGLFDVAEEQLSNGQSRTVFRPRPGGPPSPW